MTRYLAVLALAVGLCPVPSLAQDYPTAPIHLISGFPAGTTADISARVRQQFPAATALSAGMSGDYERAIDYGATHVRLGNALLGNRPELL